MIEYKVGSIYENAIGHAECTQMDLDDSGAIMVVYFKSPTEDEINSFHAGNPFEIRFTTFSDVIMLTVKIGNLNWMDVPYTPHLSKGLTKCTLPLENTGLGLTLILVDAVTGKIKSLRLIGLSENFTRKFLGDVIELKMKDFNHDQYMNSIREIYSRYPTKKLVSMANAYYKTR